jgi:hypothetical protein
VIDSGHNRYVIRRMATVGDGCHAEPDQNHQASQSGTPVWR